MNRLLILSLCLATVGWAASPPVVADDSQTLVYLSENGPVVIRLHLRLEGKSFRARYDDLIDALFKESDSNGDGVVSATELAAAPQPATLAPGQGLPGFGRTVTRPLTARDRFTRKDLAAHYALSGLKPFQISTQARDTGVIRLDAFNTGPRSAAEVNKRLFELLDTNKDGKLSRAELEAAPRVLGKLDRNEDEMVDLDELLRNTSSGVPAPIVTARPGMPVPSQPGPLHLVSDGPDEALAARLLATYATKGATSLDASKIGLGEGNLGTAELSRLGSRKPDLEAIVRLGERGGKAAVEILKKAERGGIDIAERGGKITLTAGKTVLELGEPANDTNVNFAIDVKGQYENQFTMADPDSKGYLDKAAAERTPFFRGTFAAMDRDGDGKLYLKEVLAWVDRMKELREKATASCLSLLVQEQGEGLFALLDTDRDGRLSVRELRGATKLIDRLDADGDGCLASAEVPRQHKGSFEKGALGLSPGGGRAIVVAGIGLPTPTAPRPAKGPAWFTKMDRNGDGDVSRKEFLGTDEQFRALDADGDGLITVAEAEAFEKRISESR